MPRRKKVTTENVRGPRRYLRYPEEFGLTDPVQPAKLPPSKKYLAQAALVQHDLARNAIEQMLRLGVTHNELAQQIGISPEQLRRQLRGESAMSVERMQRIAQAVALNIKTKIERSE